MKTTLPEVEEVIKIIKTSGVYEEEKACIETGETPADDYPVNRAKSRKNLLMLSICYFILLAVLWYFIKTR